MKEEHLNNIKLRIEEDKDAGFLFSIINMEPILDALNEVPTKISDWADAIKMWNEDDDEEDYIVTDGDVPIGWFGINGIASDNKMVYLKMAVILPKYHNKGIGCYAIKRMIELYKQRGFSGISLYTARDNHPAKARYRKCGFTITKTFSVEMSNGKIVERCKMEFMF